MCQYQGSPVYKHGKASSDRIMGRPAGNGAVPTPKRTMSPDKGTGGITAAKLQGLAIRYGRKGASPLHPRQGSRTLGTREKSLTAAPRTKELKNQRHGSLSRAVGITGLRWRQR